MVVVVVEFLYTYVCLPTTCFHVTPLKLSYFEAKILEVACRTPKPLLWILDLIMDIKRSNYQRLGSSLSCLYICILEDIHKHGHQRHG